MHRGPFSRVTQCELFIFSAVLARWSFNVIAGYLASFDAVVNTVVPSLSCFLSFKPLSMQLGDAAERALITAAPAPTPAAVAFVNPAVAHR